MGKPDRIVDKPVPLWSLCLSVALAMFLGGKAREIQLSNEKAQSALTADAKLEACRADVQKLSDDYHRVSRDLDGCSAKLADCSIIQQGALEELGELGAREALGE